MIFASSRPVITDTNHKPEQNISIFIVLMQILQHNVTCSTLIHYNAVLALSYQNKAKGKWPKLHVAKQSSHRCFEVQKQKHLPYKLVLVFCSLFE